MRPNAGSTRARWEHRGCEARHETKRSTLEAMVNSKRATRRPPTTNPIAKGRGASGTVRATAGAQAVSAIPHVDQA